MRTGGPAAQGRPADMGGLLPAAAAGGSGRHPGGQSPARCASSETHVTDHILAVMQVLTVWAGPSTFSDALLLRVRYSWAEVR